MDNSINNRKTMVGGNALDRSLGERATMLGLAGTPAADRSMGDDRTMRPGGAGTTGRRFLEGELLLGRYRVKGELGQGGMGVVYRCTDEVSGVDVALKALPPEVAHNSGEMEEVRANFRLVEKLHHPNIANVKTLERDLESGDFYLVMELVDGYDVRQWVRRRRDEGRPLTLDEITIIAYRIAEALDYAHEQKVIHRDIKPSNVRVTFDGDVKVLDFGLAAQISTSRSRASRASAQETRGIAPYMAPEQWRGQRQGAEADQYALAATVYELLEGAPPFEGSDLMILREAVLNEVPRPVAGAPAHVTAALLRALSKEPEARFANCGAFVKALAGGESSGGGMRSALWLAAAVALVLGYGAYRAYGTHSARRAWERSVPEQSAKLDAAQKAKAACKTLAELEVSRQDAKARRGEAEKAKADADQTGSAFDAKDLYAAGGRASSRAALLESHGVEKWSEVKRLQKLGEAGTNDPAAGTDAYAKALAALPGAVEEAQTEERATKLGSALAAALKREAEENLVSTLTVECDAPGAQVSDGGESYDAPHTFGLKVGGGYRFTVTAAGARRSTRDARYAALDGSSFFSWLPHILGKMSHENLHKMRKFV